MTPREFFLALNGRNKHELQMMETHQKLIMNAVRFNASSIAGGLSKEQAKAIGNHKFDWEITAHENRSKSGERKPISYDSMKTAFDLISKPKRADQKNK